MKTVQKGMTVVAVLMMGMPSAGAADLLGGYLNSKSREAALSFQSGNQRVQIINSAKKLQWGEAQYGSSKLFVIDASGRVAEPRGNFRDAVGHVVSAPHGAYDKVVVLNRYGNIAWASGVDENDVISLVPRDVVSQAKVIISAQSTPFFGALRYSSHVLSDYQASSDQMASMFLTSVYWMAGNSAYNVVLSLMSKSAPSYLNGVSLVSQGGDGGGGAGRVSQGGDGGGGAGLVSQGGDGGGGAGLVSQGGDGGGGAGLVSQGGDGGGGAGLVNDVSIKVGSQNWSKKPAVQTLSALTMGKVITLQ